MDGIRAGIRKAEPTGITEQANARQAAIAVTNGLVLQEGLEEGRLVKGAIADPISAKLSSSHVPVSFDSNRSRCMLIRSPTNGAGCSIE
jgi:hypothetical protein